MGYFLKFLLLVIHFLMIFFSFLFTFFGRTGSLWLCVGFLWFQRMGAALPCGVWASHHSSFSCCSIQALSCTGLVVPRHVGSF